ncbi:MAG: prepilin-type N-terminal cleavage/methylation domain-containing protein [Victivallales bacterium]|nr:prepilin-type N-terminal cleavage/methylation domain-containing protein [Victivallales bacterium]
MRRKSFTLIEMLIVSGIIALLLSLSLQAIGKAKNQARSINCMSNLRELSFASMLYCGDFDGFFIPQGGFGYSPGTYWWGRVEGGTEIEFSEGYIYPYLRSGDFAEILDCPAMPWGTYSSLSAGIDQPTTVYGYNGIGLSPPASGWGPLSYPWTKISSLKKSSEVFVFGDSAMIYSGSPVISSTPFLDPPRIPVFGSGNWTDNSSGTTHFRHQGKANIVCADGHAAGYRADKKTNPEADWGAIGFAGKNINYIPYPNE